MTRAHIRANSLKVIVVVERHRAGSWVWVVAGYVEVELAPHEVGVLAGVA